MQIRYSKGVNPLIMLQGIRNRFLTSTVVLISILGFGFGGKAQTATSSAGYREKVQYNGRWWLAANPGERGGLLSGISDCMTWEARKRGYEATAEQLADPITKFYETQPRSRELSVLMVWQRVNPVAKRKPSSEDKWADTWTNAHWYMNNDWWFQLAETEQRGYVEGYLWCVRTQVDGPHERYSRLSDFYWSKIDAFVKSHPKLGDQALAKTLSRFKDPGQ